MYAYNNDMMRDLKSNNNFSSLLKKRGLREVIINLYIFDLRLLQFYRVKYD